MANPNDEPMWATDRVVTSTPGSAITIHATANEFVIKGNHLTLVKGNQFDAFADEGSSNSDANKIMERMDMTMKMDAQYKEMKSRTECNHCGGLPNYGKFLKELVSNKHKVEQISSAFLSDKSSAIIQNKVPPKLGDPGSFLIPCTFSKTFSCNALADLGASINLMSYSLYAKLSLKTLKPTKMSMRLADRSFQYPIGIAENMLVKVGKFTFHVDFVILEMEEDIKVSLILGRPFLDTANVVIRVKQKQLNLGVDEDFDALLDEGSKILYSIEGTPLEEKVFVEFNEFIAMNIKENTKPENDEEEITFEKITFDMDYKIKKSLEESLMNLELKPLPDHLEYAFLEEPSLLPVIISSQLSEQNKDKLISVLKRYKQAFA
ncbi:reverse transcriptase domain-containing protein [Tanacetum coccineum]